MHVMSDRCHITITLCRYRKGKEIHHRVQNRISKSVSNTDHSCVLYLDHQGLSIGFIAEAMLLRIRKRVSGQTMASPDSHSAVEGALSCLSSSSDNPTFGSDMFCFDYSKRRSRLALGKAPKQQERYNLQFHACCCVSICVNLPQSRLRSIPLLLCRQFPVATPSGFRLGTISTLKRSKNAF